ncbi:hypothetical protein BKA70DRAFT_1433351 [Coprinopsis sp. MPI-PUGE-AT-0042]|nr:hypothetical protein BKA70DRAFT_1433351 [Coprinopsis sp. MPI-PUGE-AT-0042]
MPSSRQHAVTRRGRTLRRSSQPVARRLARRSPSRTTGLSATQLASDTSPPPSSQVLSSSQAPPSSQLPPSVSSTVGSSSLLDTSDAQDEGSLEDGEKYVWLFRSPTSIATLKERPCADDQLHPGETLARIPAHKALFEMTLSALDGQSRIVADSSGTRVLFQTHPEYSSKRWED